jgi:hypothetical protein
MLAFGYMSLASVRIQAENCCVMLHVLQKAVLPLGLMSFGSRNQVNSTKRASAGLS